MYLDDIGCVVWPCFDVGFGSGDPFSERKVSLVEDMVIYCGLEHGWDLFC